MPPITSDGTRVRPGECGQAAVEFVALVPAIVLAAAVCWQLVVAGGALWSAHAAARAGARALAVGADVRAVARAHLPGALARDATVRPVEDGVEVTVAVPVVLAAGRLTTVTARAAFPAQS